MIIKLKQSTLLLFMFGASIAGCSSNNVEIPEEAFIPPEPEVIEQYREQTVSIFPDQGRTFKEPGGYRFSLASITPYRGQKPIQSNKFIQKKKVGKRKLKVAKKGVNLTPKKNLNMWERYCSQGELTAKEQDYVLNNSVPEQYANTCLPGK